MRSFSTVAVLCVLVALVSSFSSASAQTLTNVTGTASCNFSTMQKTVLGTNGISQMQGWLTVNLTAGSYTQPNTPGFAGATYLSYPIIGIGGTRVFFNLSASPPTVISNILGIGANRTIYMTFDPSQEDAGYPTDNGYLYRFDYTGISILTDSVQYPSVQFAEVNLLTSNQYSELALFETGLWNNASFNLFSCNASYTVDAITTDPTGPTDPTSPSAVGDPSFTGFLGQHYQIHGMADTVYSVITDSMMQLNAQFVFLNHGQCPIVNGKPLTNCWSHPGSYFGSLALSTADGDRLLITAGSYTDGFTVTLNEQPLTNSVTRDGLRVEIDDSFRVLVEAGLYRMQIENSDMFLNIAGIQVTDWQRLRAEVQPHGLLGQTWQRRSGVALEGTVDDYAEANNALFGSQFLYNKFVKQ